MPWQVLILLEKVCFHLEVKTMPNLMLTSPKPICIQNNFSSLGTKGTCKLKQQNPITLWARSLMFHSTAGEKSWQVNLLARKIPNFLRMLPQKTKGSQTYSCRRVLHGTDSFYPVHHPTSIHGENTVQTHCPGWRKGLEHLLRCLSMTNLC